jgi:hypothetical protein
VYWLKVFKAAEIFSKRQCACIHRFVLRVGNPIARSFAWKENRAKLSDVEFKADKWSSGRKQMEADIVFVAAKAFLTSARVKDADFYG